MPVFLVHGFKWARKAIRIHIVLQHVEEASAEWICNPTTTAVILETFRDLWPDILRQLPDLRFVEQYDDKDDPFQATVSQPFAFVADRVVDCGLSMDVGDVLRQGVGADEWGALAELRDKVSPDEQIGWYVVYCGDVERKWEDGEGEGEAEAEPRNGQGEKGVVGSLRGLFRKRTREKLEM